MAVCLLFYRDHCGTESIFTEGGILVLAIAVFVFELRDNLLAEDTLAFSVDENYPLSAVATVLVHHASEFFELTLKHVESRHSGESIDELIDMEVNFDYVRLCLIWLRSGSIRLRLSRLLLFVHRFLKSVGIDEHWPNGAVVFHDVECNHRRFEVGVVVETVQTEKFGVIDGIFYCCGRF